jgi:flagellar motor protein MotB
MVGRGVASLAPLASNAAEEGRAKNRRVELVLQ